jgi:hypothetical protein
VDQCHWQNKALRAHCELAGSLEPNDLDSELRAVVIINAQSIIQVTNDAVAAVLGYTRTELKGKPLRCILPPSVADHHYSYVRNYIDTGMREALARKPSPSRSAGAASRLFLGLELSVLGRPSWADSCILICGLTRLGTRQPRTSEVKGM